MVVQSPMPRPRLLPARGPTTAGKAHIDGDRGAPPWLTRRESMKPRETIAVHCARSVDGDLDKNRTTISKRSGALL